MSEDEKSGPDGKSEKIIQSFGVGCYHFQDTSRRADTTAIEGYETRLRRFLELYPNIDKIAFDPIERIRGRIISGDENPSLDNGEGIEPWPVDWDVYFEVQIPRRLQESLNPWKHAFKQERFCIRIIYRGELPVAFIWAKSGLMESPSHAVALVREYLLKYQPESSEHEIEFQYLGPSPFHANFFMTAVSADSLFECEIMPLPGYDRIVVNAEASNIEKFQDSELFVAFSLLAEELMGYYEAILLQYEFMERWDVIESGTQDVIEGFTKNGAKGGLKTSAKQAAAIACAQIDLARFEIDAQSAVRRAQKRLKDKASNYGLANFETYIESELEPLMQLPIAETQRVLSVLDRAGQSYMQNKYVLIAAIIGFLASIIGGVVGAVLTIYLKTSN